MFRPFTLDQSTNTYFQTPLQWLIVVTDSIWIPSTHGYCSTRDHKDPRHLENLFLPHKKFNVLAIGKSMFRPFTLDQTTNTYFLTPLQWLIIVTDSIWIPSTHGYCSTRDHKDPRCLEDLFCHTRNSMFLPFTLEQTMNTYFLTPLQWLTVLTDSIWIPFHPRIVLYQRPQGSWTHGKSVSLCRKVNVLAIYTRSNHEYALSKPTAMPNSADWLHLDTLTLMGDALPHTRSSSTPGLIEHGFTSAPRHQEKRFCHEGKSMFWQFYWIKP